MAEPTLITDANFKTEVEDYSDPVLIDFYTDWCAPCKMLAPDIDELSNEFAGRFKIGKCNVDRNPQTAIRFNIRSIPTLMVFREGKVIEELRGVPNKAQIADKIKYYGGLNG